MLDVLVEAFKVSIGPLVIRIPWNASYKGFYKDFPGAE